MEAIAAADFFTVDVVTLQGILRHHVLFVIDLKTWAVELAGSVCDPHGQWRCNIFRDLTADGWGFFRHHTHLIVDRDPVFTKEVVEMLLHRGLTAVRSPPRGPNLNAYAERFIRSVRQECLRRMLPNGERNLRRALREYVSHYNGERVHYREASSQPMAMAPSKDGRG